MRRMQRRPIWHWRLRPRCSAGWGSKSRFAVRITGCRVRAAERRGCATLLAEEKRRHARGHVLEYVEEFVAGIEDIEAGVGVGGGEFPGVLYGDDIVVLTVEDQRRLAEVRVVLV